MNDKEKLLCFLYKAKEDYEASITISKQIFNKKKRYKLLNTDLGLTNYFQTNFNFKNAVFEHLSAFKPIIRNEKLIKERYWYPIGCKEGFALRLNIINQALRFYEDKSEDEVPFILIDRKVSDYDNSFEDYYPLADNVNMAIYDYCDQDRGKYFDGILDEG